MIRKLKKKNGETLVEALVSLLIAILALGLVATATLAAANMNQSTREVDEMFSQELEAAEIYSATTVDKKLHIDFDGSSLTDKEADVKVYGDGSNFASYKQYEGDLP